jgi:hypothetical protein
LTPLTASATPSTEFKIPNGFPNYTLVWHNRPIIRLGLILVLVGALVGCDRSSSTPSGNGATSAATPAAVHTASAASTDAGGSLNANVPILVPFRGNWKFNLSKTLAYWKSKGVPAAEIAQAQKIAKSFGLHPDITMGGDLAILHGPMSMEGQYQFYALHPHGQVVCGKAWHHEDRHDPGDMDKELIRVELRDNDLYLSLRSNDDAADPNDPEVVTMPILSGSAATCTADAEKDPPWSPWRTYVFDRARD